MTLLIGHDVNEVLECAAWRTKGLGDASGRRCRWGWGRKNDIWHYSIHMRANVKAAPIFYTCSKPIQTKRKQIQFQAKRKQFQAKQTNKWKYSKSKALIVYTTPSLFVFIFAQPHKAHIFSSPLLTIVCIWSNAPGHDYSLEFVPSSSATSSSR